MPGSRGSTDAGHVAIDAKATSIDPNAGGDVRRRTGARANDACYIPLSHKQSGDGAGLFAAGLAPDQIKASDALDAFAAAAGVKAGLLKIGFDIKFSAVDAAQHGITIATMTT